MMATKRIDPKGIPEIKQTACVHAHDNRTRTPIWIGSSTIMWLCPNCADGVNKELVAVVYCAECAGALGKEN